MLRYKGSLQQLMCHYDSSTESDKWDAGRCNAGTGDCSLCLLCKIVYSGWDHKFLQYFSQKRKREKELMYSDEFKGRTNLLTVLRFAEN